MPALAFYLVRTLKPQQCLGSDTFFEFNNIYECDN